MLESSLPFSQPPLWAQEAIWYQIFVERFYNGDKNNDPVPKNMQGAWPHTYNDNWKTTPWTSDWYKDAPFNNDKLEIRKWYDAVQSRRYGGDLQGIIDKLDYIQDLGVNAIYLNPINDAPSLHKYDVRNYHHVDIHFGPDPNGDKLIISQENPEDANTWQWTSADKLFLDLVEQIHARGMRVIVDFSFNHTGIEFWAWRDVLVNGINSNYADWYDINMFITHNPNHPKIEFNSWSGVKELPQIRKKYYSAHHKGFPYNGNIHKKVKKHIFDVVKRWLAPNGEIHKGIDGIRLDVADEVGLDFWQEFRTYVKKINPEAFLIGEIWWEEWPDKMMNPRPYLQGDVFDAIMFYQPYKYTRAFFAKTVEYCGAQKMVDQLQQTTANMDNNTIKAMMSMSSSHDSPRLLSSFFNKNKYKYLAKPLDDVYYKTGKPDDETYRRIKLFLAFQFTMLGSPQIWAGEEMGMWGADDPDCRKPLWWEEFSFEPETLNPFEHNDNVQKVNVGFNHDLHAYYKRLIELRKNNTVLTHGALKFIYAKDDVLIYKRKKQEEIVYLIFNNSNERLYLEHLNLKGFDLWNKKNISVEACKSLAPIDFKVVKIKENIQFKINEDE